MHRFVNESHRDAAERLARDMISHERAKIHALLATEERLDALVYLQNGGAPIDRLTPADAHPEHSLESTPKEH